MNKLVLLRMLAVNEVATGFVFEILYLIIKSETVVPASDVKSVIGTFIVADPVVKVVDAIVEYCEGSNFKTLIHAGFPTASTYW